MRKRTFAMPDGSTLTVEVFSDTVSLSASGQVPLIGGTYHGASREALAIFAELAARAEDEASTLRVRLAGAQVLAEQSKAEIQRLRAALAAAEAPRG